MKLNVALIGMAGCGKSIIGRKVAGRLNFIFFDADTDMEINFGRKVEGMINEWGEERFLRIESENLLWLLCNHPCDYVISTGGSAVLVEEPMNELRQLAATVFLDTPLELIEERVNDGRTRAGAIVGLRKKNLREIYDERLPLYDKYADWRLPTAGLSEEAVVEKIVQWWRIVSRGVCADS